jgi:hypothetical protein
MGELGTASDDRVAALVAALLGVRTDHASAQFDAAIEAALTANRLDVQTARSLRFWQRASVQAVEDYASAVLPTAFAAADIANQQGVDDTVEAAVAWDAAQPVATAWDAAQPAVTATAGAADAPPARREVAIRYVTAQHGPTVATQHRSTKETEQAVRAAFRARGARSEERSQRKEEQDRDHARATTSA